MKPKVTLSKVSGWNAIFVEVDGIKRGIIRPENGQWIAERMGCYKTRDARNRHGAFNTKQLAIEAILKASAGQPKHVVYPERDGDVPLNWQALGVSSR